MSAHSASLLLILKMSVSLKSLSYLDASMQSFRLEAGNFNTFWIKESVDFASYCCKVGRDHSFLEIRSELACHFIYKSVSPFKVFNTKKMGLSVFKCFSDTLIW
jgi:hypothetical protein